MILKLIFILIFYCAIGGAQGNVKLQSSGPTVLGANLTLSATLLDGFSGVHKYVFRNVQKGEATEIVSSAKVVNYTLKISRNKYSVGLHSFEVRVYRINKNKRRPFSLVARDRIRIPITDMLHGKLKLIQNGIDRSYGSIFPKEQVNHVIELSKEEQQFLLDDNTYIVNWYIDCSLISSTGLSFDYTYEERYQTYVLEALIEVQHNSFTNITLTPEGLSGFKCAPVQSSGYTYGYYKAIVRTDATDGSPRPPRATTDQPLTRYTWAAQNVELHLGEAKGHVKLESSGPTVRGADLTLSATFVEGNPNVERKYVFRSIEAQESKQILSRKSVVNYTFNLHKDKYDEGNYQFEVKVFERNENDPDTFHYISKDVIDVPITEILNGKLKLIQNGFDRSYGRVFPNEQVSHIIELSKEEEKFLLDGNTYIVHWYIDCSLISSTGLSFDYYYERGDKTYNLEALIEVNHDPHAAEPPVAVRKPEGLAGFKCAPIYSTGYTYGYYKASVRADATDGSPPPPRATTEQPLTRYTWAAQNVELHLGEAEGYVKLESSSPVVRGGNLTLTATFVNGPPNVERKYVFRNVEKFESKQILSKESVVNYTIKLHKSKYIARRYPFEVKVYERNKDDPDTFHYISKAVINVPVTGEPEGFVKLESSGPVVRGANVTLTATFINGTPNVERKYVFRNVEKQESIQILSKESVVNYTYKLHKYRYEARSYPFEVRVYEKSEEDPDTFEYMSKAVLNVPVTELLNGKLKMIQNGFDRTHGRIFPNEQVSLAIELSQEEEQFLTDKNTYLVHWYLDCSLISSTGLYLNHTYEERHKTYTLEALVEVEHNPYLSAARVVSRKPKKLEGFKCAPIHNAGYTYGYYKLVVRTDATDGSPPPPSATLETPSSTWQDSSYTFPAPTSTKDPWRNWRTTERYTNALDSNDHKNCTANANNAVISIKDGHMKIAMDLVFHGTVNITDFQIERN